MVADLDVVAAPAAAGEPRRAWMVEGRSGSTDGHHVEAKVPGRWTGGSSRTTGVEKEWGTLAAGWRGVTVAVTTGS